MANRIVRTETVYKGKSKSPISTRKETYTTHTRTPNDALTDEQISLLINSADDLTTRTMIMLGFHTGMRVSEITHIDVGMIDFDMNRIKIWDEKKDRYRLVYPGVQAMTALKLYVKEKGIKGPRLFNFTMKTTERMFQALCLKALGFKRSWHTVRHSYVTMCARHGIDIKIAMENTGDTARTILHTYNQPSPDDMTKASDSLPF